MAHNHEKELCWIETRFTSYGETCPGLEQYTIKNFAEAFKAVPQALAENSGVKTNDVISKLYAVH